MIRKYSKENENNIMITSNGDSIIIEPSSTQSQLYLFKIKLYFFKLKSKNILIRYYIK